MTKRTKGREKIAKKERKQEKAGVEKKKKGRE